MTIRIELSAEAEARLRERAQRRGETPEALAGEMMHALLTTPANEPSAQLLPVVDEAGTFHQDRWDKLIAAIEANGPAPALPPEALTRRALYSDE